MPTARHEGVTTTTPARRRPGAAGRPRASREQIVDAAVALPASSTRRSAHHGPGRELGRAHADGAVPPLQGPRRAHGRGRRQHPQRAQRRHPTRRTVAGPATRLGARRARPSRALRQVVQVVLGGGSSSWVHDAATLVRILEQAGYADDELAEMQVWIALSVGGYVMAESARRQGPNTPEVYAGLGRLEPEDADRLTVLIRASTAPSTRCTNGSPTVSSRRWRPRRRADPHAHAARWKTRHGGAVTTGVRPAGGWRLILCFVLAVFGGSVVVASLTRPRSRARPSPAR